MLISQGVHAAERQPAPKITPSWAKQKNIVRNESNAYLESSEFLRNKTFVENFFDQQDAKVTSELKQDYQLRQQSFESRRASGLTKVEDERQHNEQMSGFSKNALNRLSRVHIKSLEKRMKTFGESIDGIREPVAVAVLAATLYTGKTFKLNVVGLHLENRLDARDKEASMSLLLPGVKSSIGYAHDHQQVNGSVTAALLPNISAEVNTLDKGSLSLIYGLSF